MRRRACCLGYMTHERCPDHNPMLQWAILFELLVDRNRGCTVNNQWCQFKDSVIIVAAYIHVYDIRESYVPGFAGWYRVHEKTLKDLASAQAIEDLYDSILGSEFRLR